MREPGPPAIPLDPEGAPGRGAAAPPDEFAAAFEAELVRALAHLLQPDPPVARDDEPIEELLVAALRDELEAAEVAASWMADETDLDLELGLARQVGDGARHYRLVADRLRQLGIEPDGIDPRARGHSHGYRYLKGLGTAAERLAANAVRGALARLRNALVARACEAHGDGETARLFREIVDADEAWHLDFARRMVARHAVTAEDQERARHALARTLKLAEARPERRAAPPSPKPGGANA
ncbi:MAG TPA: ferritin-like domain-containing protein [Anaeromyxobacteraceae bacterium]|nr:ferritin-like domain-containing protein [Anaeromyxobacteraceae bacterium]